MLAWRALLQLKTLWRHTLFNSRLHTGNLHLPRYGSWGQPQVHRYSWVREHCSPKPCDQRTLPTRYGPRAAEGAIKMNDHLRFSQRGSYSIPSSDIKIREEAPPAVRNAILQIGLDVGFKPSQLRMIVCRVLRVAPDQSNWSEQNVWREVEGLVHSAEWFQVYDMVEAVYEHSQAKWSDVATKWQQEVNRYFVEAGVGWQLVDGILEVRGPEGPQTIVNAAKSALASARMRTAAGELHEAILDLSRRPAPDLTGAVQHAMASLECVARDVTGDQRATLGEILKRFPSLVPKPLDIAIDKAWGFASEYGRHIREGRTASRDEAELVVGICVTLVTFFLGKKPA